MSSFVVGLITLWITHKFMSDKNRIKIIFRVYLILSLTSTAFYIFILNVEEPWYNYVPNGNNFSGVPKITIVSDKYYGLIKDVTWSMYNVTATSNSKINDKIQQKLHDSIEFPCNIRNGRSMVKPTSAHSVRPGDIDIIGVLGDSISTGNGAFANNVLQLFIESRGVSFIGGGEGNWRTYLTLPNMLKEFNPNLIGYSVGRDSHTADRQSQFNVAEPGAISQDLPFMARELVKRIRNHSKVDMKNDWKMITVFVGINDFCSNVCYNNSHSTSKVLHQQHLRQSIMYLKDNLPRTIVSLILTPNVTRSFINIKGEPIMCNILKRVECSCLSSDQYKSKQKFYYELMHDWQQVELQIGEENIFNDKEDFTVISQPFTTNLSFLLINELTGEYEPDFSLLSQDCFHFSQKGLATAGNAIWNNLLQPINAKDTNWKPLYEKILCPTDESPFICTRRNNDQCKMKFDTQLKL